MRQLTTTLFLSVLGLCTAGAAQGQVFERGFVVTAAGDTLRGEIENRFWQQPPTRIDFRPAPGAPTQAYGRAGLRAFGLDGGRYFRTEVVPVDRAARSHGTDLPTRLVISQRPDTLLTEVLVDGPAPLLRVVLGDVTHYFVGRPGKPFEELVDRKYLSTANGREGILSANNYKAQLLQYFGDCPAASSAVGGAPFTVAGLSAVVQAFNAQCSPTRQPGTSYTARSRSRRSFAFNGGLLAGVGYNQLQFGRAGGGEEPALLSNLNLDGQVHPLGGLYLDLLLPGRRWMVHSEALFSEYGRKGTFALAGGAGSYTWYGTRIDARLGARNALFQNQTREVFAGGGFLLNFTTSAHSQEQYGTGGSRLTATNVLVPTQSGFIGGPAFGLGVYLEAGVRYGRFTFSLDAAVNEGASYADPLTVKEAAHDPADPLAVVTDYNGYSYSAAQFTYRALVGFRLGRRPDQPVKP
ncbi:hypothetical protein [Hymenobacter properus]|uniref:Outer membrane protein beta-barrel domain-containing protein n=1 Tax=Hymenobacter properus TaxID=2791026 RepID=A0A931BCG1_9BACT|nr:hypothetical protein [Hymenobacter properus]MBF9141249.1 hypothetical protein [Hymenobacter properus]MBR7720058.1 hypothetical protein [Microvirga sp. SRT04]